MRRQLHGCQPLQIRQPKSLDLLIETDAFRRSVGPLAAPSQTLRETAADVRVDLAEGHAWIPKVEVVLPALQVSVQPLNQVADENARLALPHQGENNSSQANLRRGWAVNVRGPVNPVLPRVSLNRLSHDLRGAARDRSEEHTSELQSLRH